MRIPLSLSDPGRDMLAVPMAAGDALLFHSLVPHYTAVNTTGKWRRAVTLSYMSSRSTYSTAHLEHLGVLPGGVAATGGRAEVGADRGPEYFHVAGRSFAGCVR
jgi:ectoine hydroxylase-related dioxygenase (phytanoyl-CoA dioxygenase family)